MGDFFGGGVVFEDLDGDPALVVCFAEGGGGGGVINLTHAGAEEVGVVGVVVGGPDGGVSDDVGHRVVLVAHRFDIEVEAAIGVVDGFEEFDCLGGAGEEVGFDGAEWFHGDGHAECGAMFGGGAEEGGGALEGVVVVPSVFERALLGAAPDHNRAAHGMAEVGEVPGVVEGGVADGVVRGGEVVAFGLGEEPVEADGGEAVVADGGAEGSGVGGGEFAKVVGEGEGGDFEAGIADLGGGAALLGEGAVLKGFVADGEAHGRGLAVGGGFGKGLGGEGMGKERNIQFRTRNVQLSKKRGKSLPDGVGEGVKDDWGGHATLWEMVEVLGGGGTLPPL